MSSSTVSPGWIKWASLAALCLQNSMLILSMRYARSVLHNTYLDCTVVVCMELVKFIISAGLIVKIDGHNPTHIIGLIKSSLPITVPSVLYVIQNTCQLAAVQNLDASTFSVLSQAKVLTTAIFSWWILGAKITTRKWRALCLLVLGCILVNYSPPACNVTLSIAQQDEAASNHFYGLLATFIMVMLSGIAGVLTERILKNQGSGMKNMSIWERNLQLSFWGMIFGLLACTVNGNAPKIQEAGFFGGWSPATIAILLLQSGGGLITAVVVKHTNTIIKGFAVGLSVVITSLVSVWLFEINLTLFFCIGASAVILSIFNFGDEDSPVPSAEAKKQGDQPGTPFLGPNVSVGAHRDDTGPDIRCFIT